MFRATHKIKALGLIVVLIMAIGIACGSDSVTPASTGQDSGLVGQPAAPDPTKAPEPTEAPAPTAAETPEPTATPKSQPEKTPDFVVTSAYNSDGLEPIDLPSALTKGSDPLSEDEVESLWTETIRNARHFISDGSIVIDTCADGTGVYLVDESFAGETFAWEVEKDPGGSWNVAVARLEFSNPDLGTGFYAGNQIPLMINSDGEREWGTYSKTFTVDTFVSPDC